MGDTAFFSLDGPLDAIPSEYQMRAANFDGFSDLVRNLGGDPRRILDRHGVNPRAISDPDYYIDCQSFVDVLEDCSTAFNDQLFGLRLAQHQGADVFGCVTALCRSAATVREALSGFINYLPVTHSPVTVMELAEGKETSELRWAVRTPLGMASQANYQAVLLDAKLLKLIGGPNFRASYVNLGVESRGKDISEIEDRIGCRFHAKATVNCVAFPTSMLDQPVPGANRQLYRLLGGYLDSVKAAARTSTVDRVEDYVRGALPSGHCSIERCAKKLGTSVRTLQAHLAENDLRFSDILERQRVELAKTYLLQGQLSLDEVAVLLGYSEQSSFGRAFKRWTGATPQRFRADRGVNPHAH